MTENNQATEQIEYDVNNQEQLDKWIIGQSEYLWLLIGQGDLEQNLQTLFNYQMDWYTEASHEYDTFNPSFHFDQYDMVMKVLTGVVQHSVGSDGIW